MLISLHAPLERITNMKVSQEKKLVYHVMADTIVQTRECPTTLNSGVNQGTTVRPALRTIVIDHVQMDHFVKLDQLNPNPVPMDITPMGPSQTAPHVQLAKFASNAMVLAPPVVKHARLDSIVLVVMSVRYQSLVQEVHSALAMVLQMKAIVLNVNQDNIAVIMVLQHPLDYVPQDTSVLKAALERRPQKLCRTHQTMIFYVLNITIVLPEVLNLSRVQKALSEMKKAADQKLHARIAAQGNIALVLVKVHSHVKLVLFVRMVQKFLILVQKRTKLPTVRLKAVISVQQATTVCQMQY